MAVTVTNPPPQTLGRFQLRRVLGQGAQGVVWLGFDPLLEREVAVKQVRHGKLDERGLQRWLGEARAVSRLSHPGIVPVFEADVQAGQPYLVFELVSGKTLADHLRSQGPMAPDKAVVLMLGVVDALEHAHAAGVIHRDLKPSNVLLGANGQPRVMDFGAAFDAQAGSPEPALMGTLAYMAPEAVAGAVPGPAMDVFSVGLMLYEALIGRPAIAESDPFRTIYRLAHEDISLPADAGPGIDDGLRLIVQRALARDPAQRYPTAHALHEVLAAWLQPAAPDEQGGPAGSGTLEFLLRRMRYKTDFPALSESVSRIQKISQSDNESIHSLANEILKDVALTQKLLRLVNSSYYAHTSGGSISTVSRAVALVGFVGIRNMAMSLVLMEHMQDKRNAALLREQFVRSVMAGIVAQEICTVPKEAEEAFIAATFQNLGKMLTQFYFPEEAEQIRRLVQAGARPGAPPVDEGRAAVSILGISYEDMSVGVARTWGLPDNLVKAMRRLPADAMVHVAHQAPERLRAVASAGNEITEALLIGSDSESHQRLNQVSDRYGRGLGLNLPGVKGTVQRAQDRLSDLVRCLNVPVQPGSNAARLMGSAAKEAAPAEESLGQSLEQAARDDATSSATTTSPAATTRDEVAQRLAMGIQDISNTLVEEGFKLHEVLRMILETLLRALDFQRVVFCLRDARTGVLGGRLALGLDAETIAPKFQIRLGASQDLFSAVCAKGADMLISDASAPNLAHRLPAWFEKDVNAPTFLLLPLLNKGQPMGLIYADRAQAGSIVIHERELALLRTLRNQALMAFKQAGK